nr:small multicopy peptide A4 [Limnephilus flavicornis]
MQFATIFLVAFVLFASAMVSSAGKPKYKKYDDYNDYNDYTPYKPKYNKYRL